MPISPIETPSASGGRAVSTRVGFWVNGTDMSASVEIMTVGSATQSDMNALAQKLVDMFEADPDFVNVSGSITHESYQTITPTTP